MPPNFLLTPHQQSLLFAALSANKQKNTASPTTKGLMSSPPSLQSSPIQKANGAGIQESPYLDNCDYDLGDSSFDFSFASTGGDQARNIGDIPDTGNSDSTEGEAHEKRSHPDDEEGDSSPGNDSKRRESTEKVAKKPGRKPLTSEPISVSFPSHSMTNSWSYYHFCCLGSPNCVETQGAEQGCSACL